MSDVEPEQVAWLAKPYLPFGKITIVQGDPGCGKTSMMLAIAADLTRGRATLGGIVCEPANVIFQTAEDGLADTIKPRLEDLGADCSRVHVIDEPGARAGNSPTVLNITTHCRQNASGGSPPRLKRTSVVRV